MFNNLNKNHVLIIKGLKTYNSKKLPPNVKYCKPQNHHHDNLHVQVLCQYPAGNRCTIYGITLSI